MINARIPPSSIFPFENINVLISTDPKTTTSVPNVVNSMLRLAILLILRRSDIKLSNPVMTIHSSTAKILSDER